MVAGNQLFWGAGDRIVFPWEETGWLHLYALTLNDGQVTPLSGAGDYEIEHVSLTADGHEALFSSNKDDIDRRHIWAVPVTGDAAHELTPGTGIEWSPVATHDGEAIAMLTSDCYRSRARLAAHRFLVAERSRASRISRRRL